MTQKAIKVLLISLLFGLPCLLYAQDEIEPVALVRSMPDDTAKVEAYHKLILDNIRRDNTTSDQLMVEAFELATAIKFEYGLAQNDELKGLILTQVGELDSAQFYLLKALSYYEEHNKVSRLAFAYDRIAQLLIVSNNFLKGQEYLDLAFKYAKETDNQFVLATVNNNQAALHIRKGWSLAGSDQAKVQKEEFKKAVPFLKTAIPYFEATGDSRGVGTCYVNLGIIQMELGNYSPSLGFMRQAVAEFETQRSDASLATVYGYMGDAFMHSADYDSALYWNKRSLKMAIGMGQNLEVKSGYGRARQIYEKQRNFEQALFYQDKYDSITSIILGEQKIATIRELEVKYQTEKQEKEIANAKNLVNRQRLIMYSTILIALVFIVLAYAVYLKRVKIERLNKELEQKTAKLEKISFKVTKKNAELNDAMQQQSNLMSVVVHDLRSPLNNVIGLLQLMDLAGKLNEEQRDTFDKILQVTNDGLSLIEDISSINRLRLKTKPKIKPLDFDKMIKDLVSMHKPSAEAKSIKLTLTNPQAPLDEIHSDRLMLARIMDNLISNAIKFSPLERDVAVDYAVERDVLEIMVVDQGPGISAEDQKMAFQRFTKLSARPTAGESSNGLGLFIVKNLVERLKGTVRIESELGKGATFIVTLPIES